MDTFVLTSISKCYPAGQGFHRRIVEQVLVPPPKVPIFITQRVPLCRASCYSITWEWDFDT